MQRKAEQPFKEFELGDAHPSATISGMLPPERVVLAHPPKIPRRFVLSQNLTKLGHLVARNTRTTSDSTEARC